MINDLQNVIKRALGRKARNLPSSPMVLLVFSKKILLSFLLKFNLLSKKTIKCF